MNDERQPLMSDQLIDNYANGIYFADDPYAAAKVRLTEIRDDYEQHILGLQRIIDSLESQLTQADDMVIELEERLAAST